MAFWIFASIVVAFGFVVFWGAPYVPSKKNDLARALDELYPLGKNDVLIDIGSGDGVVLRAAVKCGARAIGYELNPILVAITRWISRREPDISVYVANFWHIHLPSDTTIVYVFAVSRDIIKLSQKMTTEATRLKRPIMLISYGCEVPGKRPLKTLGAHSLYEFTPLQAKKA